MPQGSNHRTTTQRTRVRAKAGANKQAAGCKTGSGSKAETASIIANSIFALTLKPKPAIAVNQVKCSKYNRYSQEEDYVKMYYDVMEIVHNAVYLVTDEATHFNPYESGFDLSESFEMILNIFKREVLPKGWEFNIEKEHGQDFYHLVIYNCCDMQTFWHVFEIMPVVKYLQKKDPRLLDMFILFMHNFACHTGMMCWYNGGLGYVESELMLERLEEYEFDTEEEQFKKEAEMHAVIYDYEKGEVKDYEDIMKGQPVMPVTELRDMLSYFPKQNNLVKWMIDTCDLMQAPFTINDFIYPELVEERGEGLMFDLQMGIIWDCMDAYSCEHVEYMEAESQGCGIHEPLLTIRLFTNTEEIDFKNINEGLNWPKQLTKTYHQYNAAIKKYERPNRTTNK